MNLHFFLQVFCDDGDVTMMGIDGSFEIDVTKGNIQLQIGKLVAGVTQSVSSAMTVDGDINATVDPEVSPHENKQILRYELSHFHGIYDSKLYCSFNFIYCTDLTNEIKYGKSVTS